MIVLFVFFYRVYVFTLVGLLQHLVDVSVWDVSVRVDILHVLLQSSLHCLGRLLPYQAQSIGTIVSK